MASEDRTCNWSTVLFFLNRWRFNGAMVPSTAVIPTTSWLNTAGSRWDWRFLCLLTLGYLFVIQYGRLKDIALPAKPGRFRFTTPSLWSHIPIRLQGRWTALIWLELVSRGRW